MSLGFMMGSFRGITSRNMPKYIYMKFHGIYNICLAAEFKKVNTLFMKVNQSLGFLPNSFKEPVRRATSANGPRLAEIMLGIPAPGLIL